MTAAQDVSEPGLVIFVDDDADLLKAQTQGLELAGFQVLAFSNGPDALNRLTADFGGVVMTDVRMPHMDGLELFKRVQAIDPDIPVVLVTGHGDVAMAVQALNQGVYDFITKPFAMDAVIQSLKRAINKRQLVLENRQLRQLHLDDNPAQGLIMGDSPIIQHLRQTLAQMADAEVDVLITGDTGVGKERAAQSLHQLSPRRNRPFVQLSCPALAEETFEAELFGIEPGAKLGLYGMTSRRSVGRLEKAHKGTVFLDDIEGLTLSQQAKLLRLVEAREVWPLGAEEPRFIDIRIVAATKANLAAAVRDGQFRADLYYRLSNFTLRVPPLRERKGDIGLLFQAFLVSACARFKRPIPMIKAQIQTHIRDYDWPGNVRELEHFAERLALGLLDAPLLGGDGKSQTPGLAERVSDYEADLIREALEANRGSAKMTMAALKLPSKTFYDKLNRYGIQIGNYREGRPAS